MERMKFYENVQVGVIRGAQIIEAKPKNQLVDVFNPAGQFRVQQFRKNRLILETDIRNLVTNVAKNSILDVYFNSASPITTWFMGVINNSGFSAIAAGDTASSHAGWTEFTGYDESTRPSWGQGSAASQSITNGTPVTFTINTSGTLKGCFIISNSTKGGTSGTLWAAASFTSTVTVANGDQLKVTYTLNC